MNNDNILSRVNISTSSEAELNNTLSYFGLKYPKTLHGMLENLGLYLKLPKKVKRYTTTVKRF